MLRKLLISLIGEIGTWFYWIAGVHGAYVLASSYGMLNIVHKASTDASMKYFLSYLAIGLSLKMYKEMEI